MPHARIAQRKLEKILQYFCQDFTATQTSLLTGVSRVTINKYYDQFRRTILAYQHAAMETIGAELLHEYEVVSEGMTKGKNLLQQKIQLFGMHIAKGKIYTQATSVVEGSQLIAHARNWAQKGSTVYASLRNGCEGILFQGSNHFRVCKSNLAALPEQYRDCAGSVMQFFTYVQHRVKKFHGVCTQKFVLHLKESEMRFNEGQERMYKILHKSLFPSSTPKELTGVEA